jgi:hypothetical protein
MYFCVARRKCFAKNVCIYWCCDVDYLFLKSSSVIRWLHFIGSWKGFRLTLRHSNLHSTNIYHRPALGHFTLGNVFMQISPWFSSLFFSGFAYQHCDSTSLDWSNRTNFSDCMAFLVSYTFTTTTWCNALQHQVWPHSAAKWGWVKEGA